MNEFAGKARAFFSDTFGKLFGWLFSLAVFCYGVIYINYFRLPTAERAGMLT